MLDRLSTIIQKASYETSPKAQVQLIVDEICAAVSLDVCSLYRKDGDDNLELLASHGLDDSLPIFIPAGQGLVGRVLREGRSVNLIYPANERDYYHVAKSKEEAFLSFFGAPVIFQGQSIGVLVVQGRLPERLGSEMEGFLIALTAHLSLLVSSLPKDLLVAESEDKHCKGVSGSTGLASGKALVMSNDYLSQQIEEKSIDAAVDSQSWDALKEMVLTDLKEERGQVERELGNSMASILDAYELFLKDPILNQHMTDWIEKGYSLKWAIKQSVDALMAPFLTMDDPYLRARSEDIYHLGNRLLGVLKGEQNQNIDADENIILVGDNISVSDIVGLPSNQILGIVSYQGAALSHAAVLANALGIPAVLGVGRQTIANGDWLIVDGDHSEAIIRPSKVLRDEYRKLIKEQKALTEQLLKQVHGPCKTKDGTAIELMANAGLQADIKPGLKNGAEGIGLYRTEIPFMIHNGLPSEDEQVMVYKQVIDAYEGKPVYIRTLDIGSDKPLPYLPVIQELNPALGLRGIRFALDNYQLQLTQMRAILRAANGRDSVHITLPMVSTTAELDRARQLLLEAQAQLKSEGIERSLPKMGVMIEVPAAITLLPFWKDKIDFISIGSNDLSQYVLAVDRTSPLVSEYYDVLSPAVIHEIYRTHQIAKQFNLSVCLCGEMASNPIAILLLVAMGIRKLSMSSSKIPLAKWILQHFTLEELERLLEQVMNLDSAQAIKALGIETLTLAGLDFEFYH